MTLHAHVDRTATDCDGRFDQSYIVSMNESEITSQFGDIEFHHRVVNLAVNTYSILATGTLKVERFGVGTSEVRITWSEPTEEGSVQTEATFCTDDCDLNVHTQRDHTAESMGY